MGSRSSRTAIQSQHRQTSFKGRHLCCGHFLFPLSGSCSSSQARGRGLSGGKEASELSLPLFLFVTDLLRTWVSYMLIKPVGDLKVEERTAVLHEFCARVQKRSSSACGMRRCW